VERLLELELVRSIMDKRTRMRGAEREAGEQQQQRQANGQRYGVAGP
jgi:hypothetical protein